MKLYLGINQILMLRKGLHKNITCSDVEIIYGYSDAKRYCRRSTQKALVTLEKLELYGLIFKSQVEPYKAWSLTDRGRDVLVENLPKPPNNRGIC